MNNFAKSSLKERENLEKLYKIKGITDYQFTSAEGCDRYDSTFNFFDQKFIVECKVRANSSTKYPTTLIEKGKVDYLVNLADQDGSTPILVVFFTDGTYTRVNLRAVQKLPVEKKYCNKTTAVAAGKIMKEVFLVPINSSNTFKLDNNDATA